MRKRILFVDDEVRVLDGLQRMLRSLRVEWDMDFALSGKQALEMMAARNFDIIVSDIRMPGMDGAELLARVKKDHPDMIRFALSGQSDQETWLKAASSAHQFLSKPCTAEKLKRAIGQAASLRDRLRSKSLLDIVSGAGSLPSPPRLYDEIMALIQKPESSVHEVAKVVERDVAMSAKTLQLANSAAMGLPKHVSSPAQAIALLGLGAIRALALLIHVFEQFKGGDKLTALFLETFHVHSLHVSRGAHRIAECESADKSLVQDATVAGMLHDIGRLVFACHFPKRYMALSGEKMDDGKSLEAMEAAEFGASHSDVGACLLAIWGLPDPIVEAVALHHSPSDSSEQAFSPLAAVHAADYFVNLAAYGASGVEASLDLEFFARLGLQGRLGLWKKTLSPSV